MIFLKITHGYVVQSFNDVGEFLSQTFVAGDFVEYEIGYQYDFDIGLSINISDMPLGGNEYHSFNMVNDVS